MKQYITKEQWRELDSFKKRRFLKIFPITKLPSIGKLIEFLERYQTVIISCVDVKDKHSWIALGVEREELIDALWEKVKTVLKNE